jgi:hypothetical protein
MPDTDAVATPKEETSTAVVEAPPAPDKTNDFYQIFQGPDAYLTVILTVILVTLLKRTGAIIGKTFLDKTYVKIFFEWSGPLVAASLAMLPGLWDSYAFPVNVMVAIPCGFFAERIYKSVLSRMLPAGWIFSSDAEKRQVDTGSEPVPPPETVIDSVAAPTPAPAPEPTPAPALTPASVSGPAPVPEPSTITTTVTDHAADPAKPTE